MSSFANLQPQKRILLVEESEDLLSSSSKKPRFVEETTLQAESSSAPLSREASPREDAKNTVIKDYVIPAVDGEGHLMQTEEVNQPLSLEVGGNQSKGKKKRIRPPRVGRRSRNEEDEERGTLLSPTGEMEPKALRLPKRLCALLLGFCGSGYRGMQM
jgi:tRNA pseudouridine38-40 synthase